MSRKILVLLFFVAAAGLVVFFGWSRDVSSSATSGKFEEKTGNQFLISHAEIFGRLERPKVLFDHRKHSEALKKEGCKACHPAVTEEDLFFEFPFKPAKKDKDSMMNAYHEKCITCHQNNLDRKKKAGPVTCGECHVKKSEVLKVSFPVVEFDFYLHEKHVKKFKDKCEHCHHSYDKEDKELVYEKGTEESCYYCHDEKKKIGPALAVESAVIDKKGLTIRKVSHAQCVNCHLFYSQRGQKAGPLECSKCHTGKYRSVAELAKVPRPDRDQPKRPFITVEDSKMKGVPFDHEFHEKGVKTCRECHHETLNACKKCHGLTGSAEGKWINAAGAYHDAFSNMSCAGCHRASKADKNCSGCHHHLLDMDLQAKGPKRAACTVCHSGKKKAVIQAKPIAITALETSKVPEKVTIKILEKEFEPSIFPHRKIIRRLIEISNEKKMATHFHRDMQTICEGCHHQSLKDAESEKGKPPYCRSCHSVTFDSQNINRPRLLAAYHRECLGCHDKMGIKKTGCKDCHKEKAVAPKDILGGSFERRQM
jgi:hypothetical protein